MRKAVAAVLLGIQSVACLAQALPIGSVVEGSFVLARKVVPLPPGKFTLAMHGERATQNQASGTQLRATSPVTEALLVQAEGKTFRLAVYVRANTDDALTRWTDEPCKRADALFRLDRTQSFNYLQDCVLVTHRVGFLGKPIPATADVVSAFKAVGVVLPVRTVLEANLTRIDQFQFFAVSYWMNPDKFGFATAPGHTVATSDWHPSRIAADVRRDAFIKAYTKWALDLEAPFERGFRGQPIPADAIPALALPGS